jgi:aryl-alcohol dehydrogenase-like predicted oxidoreductase
MRYARLGESGLIVSRLAFGAMTFGTHEYRGFRAGVEQPEANRMVARALELGVNLFDTAEGYGDGTSEEILGAALRSCGGRDRAIIATKVSPIPDADPPDRGTLSYRHVVGNAETALRRLGTDWIDLYQLHLPDLATPLDETLRALDDLVRRGLVRYVGWSNFPAWYAADGRALQERHGWAPFVSAQLYYSLVGRDAEHELLPYCQSCGLGTLIWSPLASGFLTGKYTREGGAGRRATFDFPTIDPDRDYDVVDRLAAIAAEHGVTTAQAAYAWLLARLGITSLIVGASRYEQLDDNLGAADFVLPDEHVSELEAMTRPPRLYPAVLLPEEER